MTMTRERIEELKRKVAKTTNGYMMLVEPEDVDALLALAERALEPKEPVLTAGNFPDSAQGQLAQKAAALPLPNYTASKLALEPQGQALPVVAWLTEWPKDRIRNAGKLVELAEPEQKFSMNHYEPLVRLSDARSYASQLALPAGPVPEGFVLVPMHLNAEMREVLSEEDWTWEDLLVAANAVTEEQYYAIQNGDDSSPAVAQPEPTPPDVRPDTVMAKPIPVNALWDAIGVYCEAVIDDELAACGIGEKVDPRMRIGAAKRLIGLIGDRTDHDEPAYPANRLHNDAHRTPAVAQPTIKDGLTVAVAQPVARQFPTKPHLRGAITVLFNQEQKKFHDAQANIAGMGDSWTSWEQHFNEALADFFWPMVGAVAQPVADERDAARYRFLRSLLGMPPEEVVRITDAMDLTKGEEREATPEDFDASVDAGMAARSALGQPAEEGGNS